MPLWKMGTGASLPNTYGLALYAWIDLLLPGSCKIAARRTPEIKQSGNHSHHV